MKKVIYENHISEKIYDIKFMIFLGLFLIGVVLLITSFYAEELIRYSLLLVIILGCGFKRKRIISVFRKSND